MMFHLVRLTNELLMANLALEWLDSGMFPEMDFEIVSSKVGFVAVFVMTFVSVLSSVNEKVRFHQFSVLEHFVAPDEYAFDFFRIRLYMA